MRRLFAAICLLGFAFPALAEDLIPPRHPALFRNIDFYGSDLQNIFDTTLDACQNACLANRDCTAFTFNTRSNACFPKRGISDVTPYEGAMAVRMIPAEDGALALAATRAPDLGFVYPQDMSAAYDLALRIGRYYAADERAASELLDIAESRSQSGDPVAAYAFLGAALSLEDSAALRLAFPPDGAVIDGPLLVARVEEGVAPFTWLLNGAPFETTVARQIELPDLGQGYSTVTVLDGNGQSARATIEIRP
jgi:membrane carboxypeptidase/penicillin-binding protein PbpC